MHASSALIKGSAPLQGSAPPAPVPFEVEKVDEEAATKELRELGLIR